MIRNNKQPFKSIQRFVASQNALQLYEPPHKEVALLNPSQNVNKLLYAALQNQQRRPVPFNTENFYLQPYIPSENIENLKDRMIHHSKKQTEPLDPMTKLFICAIGLAALSGAVLMIDEHPVLFMMMLFLIFSK